jgi:hypothetical protein
MMTTTGLGVVYRPIAGADAATYELEMATARPQSLSDGMY